MGGRRVGQHQGVLLLFVLEEVEDPILLHQPRDKVEIRFAILHAVVPRLESSLELVLEVGKAEILEDLGDDVGHRHVLEDAAVCGPRKKPEPGDHLGPVVGKPCIAAALGKAANKAVDVPFPSAVGEGNRQGDILADDLVERDRWVFREEMQVKAEEPGNPLLAREPCSSRTSLPRGVSIAMSLSF